MIEQFKHGAATGHLVFRHIRENSIAFQFDESEHIPNFSMMVSKSGEMTFSACSISVLAIKEV
jgi:hypothetical protein